ncbi:hypothetical protein GGH19_002845 [Coemansia sp. RSA 1807]|nr:hypothetical protein GGH19_002845 [Coemansia sp. RSA 1807]
MKLFAALSVVVLAVSTANAATPGAASPSASPQPASKEQPAVAASSSKPNGAESVSINLALQGSMGALAIAISSLAYL